MNTSKGRWTSLVLIIFHFFPMSFSLSASAKSSTASSTTESSSTDTLVPVPPSSTTTTKTLYALRHAHSVANAWMSQPGNEWGDATFKDDPSLVDAVLSDLGHQQVQTLATELWSEEGPHKMMLSTVDLVVVSPLTRCLQTWELGCRPAFQRAGRVPPVLAHPWATERVYTSSDTGRPVAQLAREFADVDFSECYRHATTTDGLDWWYTAEGDPSSLDAATTTTTEWRPHGEGQYYAVPGEPYQVFAARMQKLRTWLLQRPEKCILLVSHWGVLRYLTTTSSCSDHIDNCRILQLELEEAEATDEKTMMIQ